MEKEQAVRIDMKALDIIKQFEGYSITEIKEVFRIATVNLETLSYVDLGDPDFTMLTRILSHEEDKEVI